MAVSVAVIVPPFIVAEQVADCRLLPEMANAVHSMEPPSIVTEEGVAPWVLFNLPDASRLNKLTPYAPLRAALPEIVALDAKRTSGSVSDCTNPPLKVIVAR